MMNYIFPIKGLKLRENHQKYSLQRKHSAILYLFRLFFLIYSPTRGIYPLTGSDTLNIKSSSSQEPKNYGASAKAHLKLKNG